MIKIVALLLLLATANCFAQPIPFSPWLLQKRPTSTPAAGYPYNLTNNLGAVAVWDVHTGWSTNGGTYVQIVDAGFFGYTLTNASASSTWPIRNPAALNGYDTLLFNAKNLRNAAMSASQPVTYFMVFAITNSGGAKEIFDTHTAATHNTFEINPPSQWKGDAGTSVSFGGAGTLYNSTNKFMTFMIRFDGASSIMKTNGVSVGTANAGTQNATGFTLGAYYNFSFAAALEFAAGSVHTNISSAQELSIFQIYTNRFGAVGLGYP